MTREERERISQAISEAEDGTTGRIGVRIIPDANVDAFARAKREFKKNGLHEHPAKNAALILVAPKAHQFAVVGDSELHDRVGEAFWSDVVAETRPYFARDAVAEGILRAVALLGKALKTNFVALLALAILVTAARAVAGEGFTIPPTPTHYVTDNANALSTESQQKLEGVLKSYEQSSGHQVIVYIDQTTGDVPLETYTIALAHKWRIGHKGLDDGAILFLFMKDHHVRIEVGYGLESTLTDADSSRIIRDDIVPQMKAGNTDAAVESGVAAMLATISPKYSNDALPSPAPSSGAAGAAVAVTIAIVLFSLCFGTIVMLAFATRRRGSHWVTSHGTTSSGGGWFSSSGGGDSSSSFSSDDFSSGGGDFGGGGASGSW